MSFTDYLFLPAFLLLSLLYFRIAKEYQWIILLCASLVFYSTWGGLQIFYLAAAVLIAWAAALWIDRMQLQTEAQIRAGSLSRREQVLLRKKEKKKWRRVLDLGAAAILGILILVKLDRLFDFENLNLLVPLGISYYTLSLIGYLADVYWRKERAERNPLRLLLFAAYFPKIVEGPISKHKDTAAGMFEPHDFDYRGFCFGLQRMLWGYWKKLVIADRLAIFSDNVFAVYDEQRGAILLLAAVSSALQMYCDFSGCMDIVLGASEALGIPLEENFNHPFFAKTIGEFWRRWHMSLNAWFRDYVYMPMVVSPTFIRLSGKLQKRVGKQNGKAIMNIVPLLIVWMMTGLWHGTGWNYLLWGIYWAVLMILSGLLEPSMKELTAFLHIHPERTGWKAYQCARTFLIFAGCRVIASQSSVAVSGEIFLTILTDFAPQSLGSGVLTQMGLSKAELIGVILMLTFLWYVSARQERGVVFREKIAALPIVPRWVIYLAAVMFVLIFGVYGAEYDAAAFVYMGY